MIEIKVEKGNVTIKGRGMTVDVAADMTIAMIVVLRQIRDIDKKAYKAICAWIMAGHLFREVEKDD